MATLISGLVVSFLRIGMELASYSLPTDGFLHCFATANFLTFAAWFFLFSVITCLGVSFMYPAPLPEQIQGLTYGSLTEEQKAANRASYSVWDIVFSLLVIGIVAYVMITFTG
jgi:SSS family solute:Na+ symporter